jgi:hypothetical protein
MGASRVYKAGSPYNGADLCEIDYEQTSDTLYLAHLDHAPTKLVRAGHTSWSFAPVQFAPAILPPAACTVLATVADTDAPNTGLNYFPQSATYCVTVDDDGDPDETERRKFATKEEAERCWPESLAAAKAAASVTG